MLREYGVADEEIDQVHNTFVSRLAAPMVLLLCAPFVGAFVIGPLAMLINIWVRVNGNVVYGVVMVVVTLSMVARVLTVRTRVLSDVRVALVDLIEMRACHLVDRCDALSGITYIELIRAKTKRNMRTRARSLKKNVAILAGREVGDPGFERCEYLAVWLYWASEDLDDEVRVHRAIRACGQMLLHHIGGRSWLIPEISKPPSEATVVPSTPLQRIRPAIARAIQAGSITATVGVITAIITLTAKIV
ncbi:hypothetical protein ACFQ68_16695 [Amycolatopsis japonica]|uniref:hypothetical protein n=1 Tax=Amycolatopsis japonica TaxID=208439 RepID=UPI003671D4EE